MVSLQKYLPAETIELPKPSGGMFLWIRLKVDTHPSYSSSTPQEIGEKVFQAMIEEKILSVPGHLFKTPGGPELGTEEDARKVYLRLSFSLPTEEEMEEGAKRMGRALKEEWGSQQWGDQG